MTAPLTIPNTAMIAFKMGVAEAVAAELDRLANEHEPDTNIEDYDQSEVDQDNAVRGVCLPTAARHRVARCLVTTTGQRERQAPAGHHWVWRPTVFAEPLHVWEVLGAEHIGRECRYGTRAGQPGCGDQAVARLNLARDHEWPVWAHYCGKHLFTRRIVDGELQTCVLEPIPAGEAA